MNIQVEHAGAVVTLRLARPEKKNALTLAMYDALTAALEAARINDETRAVIITGQPGVFTAGNDLGDFLQNPPSSEGSPVFRFLETVSEFPKPLIAAVDGFAVGIGTTLLLHCDIAIATHRAQFRLPFVNLGVVPEAASSLLLPQRVGMATASLWLMTGAVFNAEDALRAGLVSQLVTPDELESRTRSVAETIAAHPPEAMRLTKKLLRDPHRDAVRNTLATEGALFLERLASDEARQAMMSFFSKK